jgi:hypothetical protein
MTSTRRQLICARPLAVLVVVLSPASQAAPAPQANDNLYNHLRLLRSEFNSAKVDIINRIMKLSDADAKKFWPLYREYEKELGEQAINHAQVIAQFVQSHQDGTFDDAQAQAMSRQ